jgi:YHS domain-containing protein
MLVHANTALNSIFNGKTYYFCNQGHKDTFDRAPEKALYVAKAG